MNDADQRSGVGPADDEPTDRTQVAAQRVAAMPNPPPPGDWTAGTELQLDLSGGGVRAALCSIGMIWWLLRRGEWPDVTRVVSVSGGSLVNARIALNRPSDDTLEGTLRDLYLTFTNRWRVGAIGGAIGGCIGLIGIAAFVDAGDIEQATPFIVPALVLWLVCLWFVRVVYTPLALLVACFVIAWVELPPRWEWVALGLTLIAGPALALTVAAIVRSLQLDLPLIPRRDPGDSRRSWIRRRVRGIGAVGWLQIIGLTVLVAAGATDAVAGHEIEALAWRYPLDALRSSAWVVLAYGTVQGIILPLIVREHFATILRLPDAATPDAADPSHSPEPSDARISLIGLGGSTTSNWRVCHVICTADLREDAANFFVLATNGERVLATEAVNPNVAPRLADARRVPIPTAMQASSAFIPTLQPVVPLSTRAHPLAGDDWSRPLRIQVLLDGGIHGTLGTQFDLLGIDRDPARWAFLDVPPRQRRLVLDAARYRSSPGFWPLTLLPKYGSTIAQLRVMQMLLRGVVRAERDRSADIPTRYVRATGATMAPAFVPQDAQPGTAEHDIAELHRVVIEMRSWVDATGSWWPSRRQGLRCIAATCAAAFQELQFPDGAPLAELRTELAELEDAFGRPGDLDLERLFGSAL